MTPLWADVERMADLFSLPVSTFREYVARGLLPQGVKLAGKRLWKVADVDAALEAMKLGADSVSPAIRALERIDHAEKAKGRRRAIA